MKDPKVYPIVSGSTIETACAALRAAAEEEEAVHVADELLFLAKVLPKITIRPEEIINRNQAGLETPAYEEENEGTKP